MCLMTVSTNLQTIKRSGVPAVCWPCLSVTWLPTPQLLWFGRCFATRKQNDLICSIDRMNVVSTLHGPQIPAGILRPYLKAEIWKAYQKFDSDDSLCFHYLLSIWNHWWLLYQHHLFGLFSEPHISWCKNDKVSAASTFCWLPKNIQRWKKTSKLSPITALQTPLSNLLRHKVLAKPY